MVFMFVFCIVSQEMPHMRIHHFDSPLRKFIIDSKKIGILARQALSKASLPAYDRSIPLQPAILFII